MARVSNTLIGKSSGSIGGVTLSTWKGINVARSKPTSVANPNTAGQQLARSKMANAVYIFRTMAEHLKFGFSQKAVKKSSYNAFVAENLKNGSLTGADKTKIAVPANFVAASGTLSQQSGFEADAVIGDPSIAVSWDTTVKSDQTNADLAFAVAVKSDGTICSQSFEQNTRIDGAINLPVIGNIAAGTYNVYLFFFQNGTNKVSTSQHLAIVAHA